MNMWNGGQDGRGSKGRGGSRKEREVCASVRQTLKIIIAIVMLCFTHQYIYLFV